MNDEPIKGWTFDTRPRGDDHGCRTWYLCSDEQRDECVNKQACQHDPYLYPGSDRRWALRNCKRYSAALQDAMPEERH